MKPSERIEATEDVFSSFMSPNTTQIKVIATILDELQAQIDELLAWKESVKDQLI